MPIKSDPIPQLQDLQVKMSRIMARAFLNPGPLHDANREQLIGLWFQNFERNLLAAIQALKKGEDERGQTIDSRQVGRGLLKMVETYGQTASLQRLEAVCGPQILLLFQGILAEVQALGQTLSNPAQAPAQPEKEDGFHNGMSQGSASKIAVSTTRRQEAQRLLAQGVAAAQAGQQPQALEFLRQAADLNPNDERVWTWLYGTSDDLEEKKKSLQQALAINPKNTKARQALHQLTGVEPALGQPDFSKAESQANRQLAIYLSLAGVLCCLLPLVLGLFGWSFVGGVTPTAIPVDKSRCSAPSDIYSEMVRMGVKAVSPDYDLSNLQSVRSFDMQNVSFIAAQIITPDSRPGVGVWAIFGDNNLVLSVNDLAAKYSTYGRDPEQANLDQDGARAAEACAR